MRAFFLGIVLFAACAEPVSSIDPDKEDADADGWPGATDCDDTDPLVNPSAREVCDDAGMDEDCDLGANDADPEGPTDPSDWYPDTDGDGYAPEGGVAISACAAPVGYAGAIGDCDDGSAAVHPGASELCDPTDIDEDCNGVADDDDSGTDPGSFLLYYADVDGDGYGNPETSTTRCEPPEAYVADPGDCDDSNEHISPGAVEVCDDDDTDEDCNGMADDGDADPTGQSRWYADEDGDGYGGDRTTPACDLPAGHTVTATDCDDSNPLISPVGTEVCDGAGDDEDCDTLVDDADPTVTETTVWYGDGDGDGHGGYAGTAACIAPPDHYATSTDCDDTNASISPSATEVCDEGDVDQDCDGLADDDDTSASGETTWYVDLDGDGWGTTDATLARCDEPAGYAAAADDCDDADDDISPGEPEICGDGVDQDCDSEDPDCRYTGSADPDDDFIAKVYGGASGDELGHRVEGGDFDGDGVGDLMLSAPSATYLSSGYGIVVGHYGVMSTSVVLATYADDVLYYNVDSDHAGSYGNLLVNLGDLDGDAADDLLIGGADEAAWVHLGGGSAGIMSTNNEGDFTCSSAAAGGDMTSAAGSNDWLCGYGEDDIFGTNRGSIVVYDGPSTADTVFLGESDSDYAGNGVAAGDVDGDGYSDLWIGAYGDDDAASSAGAAYLVYGPVSGGLIALSTADAKVLGAGSSNLFGTRVAMPGDVDGDGYDDLLASAPFASSTGVWEGKVYLFTSVPAGSSGAAASAEATFVGENSSLFLGANKFTGGDVDGDSDLDLLFGSPQDADGGATAGATWLVYGPHSGTTPLTGADASWRGDDAADLLGTDVTLVPDQDGDGDSEIAMGAPAGDAGSYTGRGAVWVLEGR
ncbi:MAG: putative metal-binding motif-containing protein [Pseudomonadota bacterium]|nr:putative metal-binding motif-containing protein [Pseudomonadota bacterium]